jgi:hypothetical protein
MLPAAGLPIRLRAGLSQQRSSACAAARPGQPAGHRTRRPGLRRRSRVPSAAAAGAGPIARRRPSVSRTQGRPGGCSDRWLSPVCVPAVAGTCMPRLRNRSFCCSIFLSASARVSASAPRPHATSPKPAALAHAARARRRRPAAQCPAPTAAWVTAGATGDTHSSPPEGLAPSRKRIEASRCTWALPSSRAIPALSPRRRVRAKLPYCRYPRRCRPAGPGRRRCPGPAASALAPRRSSAQPDLLRVQPG